MDELNKFLLENPHMFKDQWQLEQAMQDMGSGERLVYITRIMLHNLRDLQAQLVILLEEINGE